MSPCVTGYPSHEEDTEKARRNRQRTFACVRFFRFFLPVVALWQWRWVALRFGVTAVRLCVTAVPRVGMSLMPRRAVTFGGTKVTKIPTGEGPRDPPALWVAVFGNLVAVYRYLRYLNRGTCP